MENDKVLEETNPRAQRQDGRGKTSVGRQVKDGYGKTIPGD